MGRLTSPDDMPEPFYDDSGDRADAFRDSLGDLRPVPTYQHRTVTREELLAVITGSPLINCGQQVAKDTDK